MAEEWQHRDELRSPEVIFGEKESDSSSFEDRAGEVTVGRVKEILKDTPEIRGAIVTGNPTTEEQFDAIGEKFGLGAEEVAAVAMWISGSSKIGTN